MSTPRLPTCIMVVSMLWRNPSEGSSRPCRPSLTKMLKRDSPPPSAYFVFGHEVRGDIRSNRLQEQPARAGLKAELVGNSSHKRRNPFETSSLLTTHVLDSLGHVAPNLCCRARQRSRN